MENIIKNNNTHTQVVAENKSEYLNTILYGPPGTGKTYRTVKMAAEIITNRTIDNYEDAKDIFRKNLGGNIIFTTFHQNYSYEDFIQGIKPSIDDEGESSMSFSRIDGVFKEISDRAKENYEAHQRYKNNTDKTSVEIDTDKLIRDFSDYILTEYIDNGKEFPLERQVTIKEVSINDKNNTITFVLGGSVQSKKRLGKKIITRDINRFLNGEITSKEDIASTRYNVRGYHGNASYFFKLYTKIKDYYKRNKKTYEQDAQSPVDLQRYVIVIDEINRANISRVFGELITLIEPDKRMGGDVALSVTLPSGEEFEIPPNLYIIGTMNTADKSIALLDIALRRRFEFVPMYPQYDGIAGLQEADFLKALNKKIIETKGHDFQIGHAYFIQKDADSTNFEDAKFKEVMEKKIIPLLLEYYRNNIEDVKPVMKEALKARGFELNASDFPLTIKPIEKRQDKKYTQEEDEHTEE